MKVVNTKNLLVMLAGILIVIMIYQCFFYENSYKNKSYISSFIFVETKNEADRTINVYDKNNNIHDIFVLKVKDESLFNWIQLNTEYLAQYEVDNTNNGDLMFIKYPSTLNK